MAELRKMMAEMKKEAVAVLTPDQRQKLRAGGKGKKRRKKKDN